MTYLIIFIGGGLGSIARFITSSFFGKTIGVDFPWGTLAVNLIGAFLIGTIVEVLGVKYSASENLRYLLVTGLLGGFTTFSAFSLECSSMLIRGDYTNMILYATASVVGSIIIVIGAMHLVRIII